MSSLRPCPQCGHTASPPKPPLSPSSSCIICSQLGKKCTYGLKPSNNEPKASNLNTSNLKLNSAQTTLQTDRTRTRTRILTPLKRGMSQDRIVYVPVVRVVYTPVVLEGVMVDQARGWSLQRENAEIQHSSKETKIPNYKQFAGKLRYGDFQEEIRGRLGPVHPDDLLRRLRNFKVGRY